MKIAILSHYFAPEPGATGARLLELSREWVHAGHSVRVLTCFPNHPTGIVPPEYRHKLTQHEILEGVDVFRSMIYVTPGGSGSLRRLIGQMTFIVSSLMLSAPRVGAIDVAIGSSPTLFSAVAACLFSMARRIPFIFEVRDLWPAIFVELGALKPGIALRILEAIEMWLYRRAARIVVVTEAFRETIGARGIDRAKIAFIPNGADVSFFTPGTHDNAIRRQYAPDARFVALYIGAHGISQRLITLLDTAEKLRDRRDIAFLIVGEGAERDMLIAEVARRKLSNVQMLPAQPKALMPDFYRMADACFVPLRDIPLFAKFIPSKMFEIMACGRPILGSVSGEARQILERSGGALCVDPEDAAGLEAAVVQLADDPLLAAQLGAQARAFVESNYRRDVLAARYLEVLRTVTPAN